MIVIRSRTSSDALVTLIFLILSLVTGCVDESSNSSELTDDTRLLRSKNDVDTWLVSETGRTEKELLRTGVFLTSVSPIPTGAGGGVKITAWIWQNGVQSERRADDFEFVNAEIMTKELVYEHIHENRIYAGYKVKLELTPTRGFDPTANVGRQTLKLRLRQDVFGGRYFLVPDLKSYSNSLPHDLPGVSTDIILRGWKPVDAYFAATKETIESNLGRPDFNGEVEELSFNVIFIRERNFGDSWINLAGAGLVGLVILNLLLVLMATRFKWLRRVILSPIGSSVVGLIVGKYLVIDFLLHFVAPLRRALFRDYRHNLTSSAWIQACEEGTYVPPRVDLPATEHPIWPAEHMWENALATIMAKPEQKIWWLEGESGLGKTALLHHWAAHALKLGGTPLFIHLGARLARDEFSNLISQYGDVEVDTDTVESLISAGGFVLLLDGLNEDMDPQATLRLAHRIVKRNVVVLSGQQAPEWGASLSVKRIELHAFGREQWLTLLNEPAWVERIASESYLAAVAKLPQTAQLLAKYIARNQKLPSLVIDIYDDMISDLITPESMVNLEVVAWEIYQHNHLEFESSERTPESLCRRAREAGIVTPIGGKRYRFVHERIHRYFVARHLDHQLMRPLEDWHSALDAGLSREYWSVTFELWAELFARRALIDKDARIRYEAFLIEVGEFSPLILGRHLFPQSERLRDRGLELGTETLRQLAHSMAR